MVIPYFDPLGVGVLLVFFAVLFIMLGSKFSGDFAVEGRKFGFFEEDRGCHAPVLSNPCIEYWFLLHYNEVNREISSVECLARLRAMDAEYSKGDFSAEMKKVLILYCFRKFYRTVIIPNSLILNKIL